MGTILFIAFLVILGIIIKKIVISVKEELEEMETSRELERRRLRDAQEAKKYYKEKVLKNTLWWSPPKNARILLDTNVLSQDWIPKNKWVIVSEWLRALLILAKRYQLKIIILPEVYEELYQNGKKDAYYYLYRLREKFPKENLEMELPLQHFGSRGRFADKKLLEYMLNNNDVYLFTFDDDLINRLISRSSDRNVKKRICEQYIEVHSGDFWCGFSSVVNEHFGKSGDYLRLI